MFPYAIRAIEVLAPKAFIFENVKGLLRTTFAEYFDYILLRLTYPGLMIGKADEWRDHLAILKKLEAINYVGVRYDVKFKLINAADFGIPQTRERVVIVGTRSDLEMNWEFPVATHSEDRLLWDMYVSGGYWSRHKMSQSSKGDKWQEVARRLQSRYGMFEPTLLPWQTVRDALADVPCPQANHQISDHSYKGGARTYPGHTGSHIDWPSKTIKAGGHGVPGGENMIRYEDGSVRYFTVFEAKRIQTFPDSFVIKGAWGEAMRQIGNAVPVKLASVLGEHMWSTLNTSNK